MFSVDLGSLGQKECVCMSACVRVGEILSRPMVSESSFDVAGVRGRLSHGGLSPRCGQKQPSDPASTGCLVQKKITFSVMEETKTIKT